MRRLLALSLLLLAAVLPAACGDSTAPAAKTTTATTRPAVRTPSVDGCLPVGGDVSARRFGDAQGAIVGHGAIGAVFANQSGSDLCAWVGLARELARRGVASALFDWQDGYTTSPVLAAARALRADGAHRVTAVGASVGGRVVIMVAARPRGAVDAIVSLSGERNARFAPFDLLPTARRDRLPTLYAGSREDSWTSFGQDSRQLYRAMPARHKRLLMVGGADHGTLLLGHPDVRHAMISTILKG